MKKVQLKTNFSPWVSDETIAMIKQRNELHSKAAVSGLRETWLTYKKLRNKIVNRLRTEESEWQSKKLSESEGDAAKRRFDARWIARSSPALPPAR